MKNTFVSIFTIFFMALTTVGCSSVKKIDVPINMPSQSGVSAKSIAVMPFKGGNYGITGDMVSAKLQKLLGDQGFVGIDSMSSVKLYVNIVPTRYKLDTFSKYHEGKKENYYTYHAVAEKSMQVSFYLMQGSKTLASNSETFSFKDKEKSYDSISDAKKDIKSESKANQKLINSAADYLLKNISPYKKNVGVRFLKGDDKIETGIEYVERGREEQALSIFEQIEQNSGKLEIQSAAVHNQAMVKLIKGEYTQAYDLLRKANLMQPENLDILDSLEQVEKLKSIYDSYVEQTKSQ